MLRPSSINAAYRLKAGRSKVAEGEVAQKNHVSKNIVAAAEGGSKAA